MIRKANTRDESLPWRSSAYHVAARYRSLDVALETEGIKVGLLEIEVEGRILPHVRKRMELFYCIEGEGTFMHDEADSRFAAGDCFVAPSRSLRGIVNTGNRPLRLLVIQPTRRRCSPLSWLKMLRKMGKW